MKKLIFLLFLIVISCSTPKWTNIGNSYIREITTYNIDSICKVDSLPQNVEKWKPLHLKNYEDGKIFTQYLYIKDSIIYVRTDSTIRKRL